MKDVLEHAWAESTQNSYGSGLLVYHVFCDLKGISDEQRAPASNVLLQAFISSVAGAYSGKTLNNYVMAIRAWHILHGVEWKLDKPVIDALLEVAENLAPATSKRKKCVPCISKPCFSP